MNDRKRKTEFAENLRQHQSRVYAYIRSLVRDFDDADDLFQQTAVILWNKFDTYDRDRSFFSWACGIARFEVSNYIRSRSRQKLYFTDDLSMLLMDAHDDFRPDEMEDRRDALSQCIQKLRDRDRELVRECYTSEQAVNDVANRRGRSSHSVYNSLRRIRRSLHECIERTLAIEIRGAK
jgi:RNA polymerase sigma-70 factor, ECF subfamily